MCTPLRDKAPEAGALVHALNGGPLRSEPVDPVGSILASLEDSLLHLSDLEDPQMTAFIAECRGRLGEIRRHLGSPVAQFA